MKRTIPAVSLLALAAACGGPDDNLAYEKGLWSVTPNADGTANIWRCNGPDSTSAAIGVDGVITPGTTLSCHWNCACANGNRVSADVIFVFGTDHLWSVQSSNLGNPGPCLSGLPTCPAIPEI